MSRRSKFALFVPLALLVAYFGVTGWIRHHVDDLIQHAVGAPLPAFTLPDRDGRTWSNADLQGKRVLLHFFRSFCGVCEAEAPSLRELEAHLPDDVVLLHVMTDQVLGFEPAKTAETIAREHFRRPVLMADAAFADAFHKVKWSNVTPVTYVVDAHGIVRFGLRGAQPMSTLLDALAACGT